MMAEDNIIKVGNKDVGDLLGLDIAAFQFAEGGAGGYDGGVFFVTAEGKVYFTCYLEPCGYTGYAEYISCSKRIRTAFCTTCGWMPS